MRRAFIAIAVAALVGPAAGQVRQSTLALSCNAAAALVEAKSAVVFSTGPNTYDRFFASPLFCSILNQAAVPQTVPTSDSPDCRVGYVCTSDEKN